MKAALRPAGVAAILIEVENLDAVVALDHALTHAFDDDPAVVDIVPAARTVLVTTAAQAHLARVRSEVAALAECTPATPPQSSPTHVVTIPVYYDGRDLAEVATMTGMTEEEVIGAHTGSPWRCAFVGFAPGFPYLVGGDPRLTVARRSEPRTHVQAGAVGLAGTFSGVYPRVSPGGWQLIGHTDEVMWDLDRTPPALVHPGDTVRFVNVDADTQVAASRPATGRNATLAADSVSRPAGASGGAGHPRSLAVLATGPLSIFVDDGRPGLARLGVAASGAADRGSYRLGQRLLDLDEDGAAIEVTFGGLRLHARGLFTMVVTGADAGPTVDGARVGMNAPFFLLPGQVLALGAPASGLRSYVAVRGGFLSEPILGSRSTDVLSGIGPPALTVGDELRAGSPGTLRFAGVDQAPMGPHPAGPIEVEVVPGPRDDWFTSLDGPHGLTGREWTVSPRSNRVGIRLEGAPITRHLHFGGELPTEGMVRGAVQVPAGGQPVVFLADHPVTGGYPVIGVVAPGHLDLLAQAVPGAGVRFHVRP